jgi:hypothetical protein
MGRADLPPNREDQVREVEKARDLVIVHTAMVTCLSKDSYREIGKP